MTTYARFASSPIGTGLAAIGGGAAITTTVAGANLNRTARSDISHDAGKRGAEFVVLGDADLLASVGVLQPSASLDAALGASAQAVAWRLATGEVVVGGAVVASGIAAAAKGDMAGVLVDLDADTLTLYLNGASVHTRALPQTGATWHFGVSLGSAVAGAITCTVNAGQWIPSSAAAAAGWAAAEPAEITLQLADSDWLSATTDTPANARYEGLIGSDGIDTYAAMHHWAWEGTPPTQGGNAQVTVLDPDGQLDALLQAGVRGLRVSVRMADASLAGAVPVARYTADSIEVVDDVRKVLHLRGAHDLLDKPLSRAQFLPNTPTLAGRPVPVVIGAVASIPALPAAADGSVSFLGDKPLTVMAAMDRGDPLTPVSDWQLDPSGQQLLLANAPVQPVTVDGSTIAADTPATLEQALREVFARAGLGAWKPGDVNGGLLADARPGCYPASWVPTANTSTEVSIVADGSCASGYAMRIGNNSGNDGLWARFGQTILFDPNKLYRVRGRVRVVSGPGSVYVGIAGLNSDRTRYITTSNTTSTGLSGSHYTASAVKPAVWTEYVAYFKGQSAGARTGAGTLANPYTVAASVTYITPMIAANYSGQAGETDLDYLVIEDAEAAGIGYYDAQGGSCRDALMRILPTYGASWYADADGTLRVVRLVDPAATADIDLAFDLDAADLLDDLVIVRDDAPNLTRRMAYRPNAYVHGTGDLVTDLEDVPPARRTELTSTHRGEVYSRLPLPARYAHADSNPPMPSLFWRAADAQAEIDRTLTLYAVERNFYRWRVRDAVLARTLKPGAVGRITYPRYGLTVARKVLVRDIQANPVTGDLTATFWG